MAPVSPGIVMFGPAPGVPHVAQAYRDHGLFRRWPLEYVAIGSEEGARASAAAAFAALRAFSAHVARGAAAVVHVHAAPGRAFWHSAAFAALALATRRALLLQLHGAGFPAFYERAGAPGQCLLRWLFRHAACVAVSSDAMRTWVQGLERAAAAVCLPYPFPAREAHRDPANPSLVLYLASLEAHNGVFDLLEALAAVRGAVPDVRLLCAGPGDRAPVARHAERLGIADMVRFTGWVGPSGRRALFESAALLALPCHEEPAPESVLEAMAAGVPVIASSNGAMPEVLADGVSGFLVAPGDVSTLQRLLRKLLLDRAAAQRVGAAARESVQRRFAPERALARLGEVYAALGVRSLGEPGMPPQDPRARAAAL